MKFRCQCDNVIPDQTDFLPYKGHLIADQDWEDFHESYREPWRFDHSVVRTCYQCSACGRLYLEGPNSQLVCFVPEGEVQQVLQSSRRSAWRAPLIAIWQDVPSHGRKGHIECSADGGAYEEFEDWSTMEKAYFKLFAELRALNRVRSAFLRCNGKTVHSWQPDA
jgi:hypothetical protein